MSTERSDLAYSMWSEAAQKLDYFILGVSGALTAYVGQNFHPSKLGLNASTVELAALACLLGSVVAGYQRIEAGVITFRLMHQRLYAEEGRGSLLSASQGKPVLNAATGDYFTPDHVSSKAASLQAEANAAGEAGARAADNAGAYYTARNRLLLLGFSLLVLARVLGAYF